MWFSGFDYTFTGGQLAEKLISEAATSPTIQFQSYAEAYNTDFEDIRRRIPDLSRIHSAIGYVPRYDLEHIIRELIVAKRRSSMNSMLHQCFLLR